MLHSGRMPLHDWVTIPAMIVWASARTVANKTHNSLVKMCDFKKLTACDIRHCSETNSIDQTLKNQRLNYFICLAAAAAAANANQIIQTRFKARYKTQNTTNDKTLADDIKQNKSTKTNEKKNNRQKRWKQRKKNVNIKQKHRETQLIRLIVFSCMSVMSVWIRSS